MHYFSSATTKGEVATGKTWNLGSCLIPLFIMQKTDIKYELYLQKLHLDKLTISERGKGGILF